MRIDSFVELSQWIRQNPNRAVRLTLLRDGQSLELALTVGQRVNAQGQTSGFLGVRPQVPEGWQEQVFAQVDYGFVEALWRAPEKLWDLTVLTLRAIVRLITGQSGLEQLSGPVGIAQAAGNSLDMGMIRFIQFLAVLSLSLAVLNLLPLPMLDGGHLLLFALEGITGRALPESWLIVWQKVGFVLIVTLTLLAVFSDVKRLFGG
jgi:regulator of sigma E protease